MSQPFDISTVFNDILKFKNKYRGEVIVIKFGGALAEDDNVIRSISRQAAFLSHNIEAHVIVVHGGGNQIDEKLKKEGIEERKDPKNGLRLTDKPTLEVCDNALRALNGKIVRLFQEVSDDVQAMGMAGYDGGLVVSDSLMEYTGGYPTSVDDGYFQHLMRYKDKDIIPVIYPICWSNDPQEGESRLNVNADYVAAAIASKLNARRLIFCTDTPGVMDKEKNILTSLSTLDVDHLIDTGVVTGGMVPKLRAAAELPKGGVVILDGAQENAILLEVLYEKGAGTLIRGVERMRDLRALEPK